MLATSQTTTALLAALRSSASEGIWREFDGRYRPILVGFAMKLGLEAADADDVAQETLLRFIEEYRAGKFDRERGPIRSWIIGIARGRVTEQRRARARRREQAWDSELDALPDDGRLSQIWDEECAQAILDRSLAKLYGTTKLAPRTLRAVRLLVRDEREPAEVAAELGMTVNDVYVAKHRVLDKLRPIVAEFARLYEIEV